MPKKDIYKYVPWLAVGLAGLIFASVGRYVILKNGGDIGTANLIFIIVIVCTALAYILLIAFTSSITEIVSKLKKKGQIEPAEPEPMPDQQPEEIIFEPETKCIEMYANGETVDEMMKPLRTEKLDNADLFHFGWNMHKFFKTSDKQAIVVDWLQAVFENLRKLDYTTIIGKLKHNERTTYLIPIVKDIRGLWLKTAKK